MAKAGRISLCFLTIFFTMLYYAALVLGQGQTTGAIRGNAFKFDTRQPVVGVIITVKNQDTGLERTTLTNKEGIYFVSTLPPGLYNITATHSGYESDSIKNFPI